METCPLCQKLKSPPPEELVAQFPGSLAFLGPWQFYVGYCVLVARQHATELFHLVPSARQQLLEEMTRLAAALAAAFQPRKMNYELLGNQVGHLHWHLFPRYDADPERLKPVWVGLDRAERDPAERLRLEAGPLSRAETIRRIQAELGRLP